MMRKQVHALFFSAGLLAMAVPLAGCPDTGAPTQLVQKPGEVIASAKTVYAEALEGLTALAKNGKISDDVIVNRVEPAREAAADALNRADALLLIKSPQAADYADTALNLATTFLNLYKDLNK